jgi:hypothetical protein
MGEMEGPFPIVKVVCPERFRKGYRVPGNGIAERNSGEVQKRKLMTGDSFRGRDEFFPTGEDCGGPGFVEAVQVREVIGIFFGSFRDRKQKSAAQRIKETVTQRPVQPFEDTPGPDSPYGVHQYQEIQNFS